MATSDIFFEGIGATVNFALTRGLQAAPSAAGPSYFESGRRRWSVSYTTSLLAMLGGLWRTV